jgi:hypothetical protein
MPYFGMILSFERDSPLSTGPAWISVDPPKLIVEGGRYMDNRIAGNSPARVGPWRNPSRVRALGGLAGRFLIRSQVCCYPRAHRWTVDHFTDLHKVGHNPAKPFGSFFTWSFDPLLKRLGSQSRLLLPRLRANFSPPRPSTTQSKKQVSC